MVLNFFVETFALGVKNIHLHKLRSLLTTLGIILGVAAVIIMVAIGEGSKQAALAQVRQLGAQNIILRSIPPAESNDPSGKTQRMLDYGLRRVDVERLRASLKDGLKFIVPVRDTQMRVVGDERRVQANAIGTEPEIFEVIRLPLDRGRYFTQVDVDQETSVCVVGAESARQLFPYSDPIGQMITVGSSLNGMVKLEVVGVLQKTGLTPGGGYIARDIDMDIYFPLSLARTIFGDTIIRQHSGSFERKSIELTEVWLQAKSFEEVEAKAGEAENVLLLGHKGPKDYDVKVPLDILRNAEQLSRTFNFLLGGIAAISLLVGGIGIMNIMLASITERTKEIGIRRALGAKQKHITLQFLIETTVISLTGGIIGIALGAVVATVLPPIVHFFSGQNYPTQLASWSIIGSFVVSALVGIGFGLYPAMTAAKMNPIEALRHE
jgi:putative ABC transport system permease protein